ncbi:bifunctional alpha,alpha-trehalose-phosphate synthase (UDP-forming)/trehalose-phosphatase [Flavobacterium sp. MFBS3-15]|uniref:bifunctional alpha,alpha-trehalose-phosphate synthase (UDP-forming)/trehalose-phosphatase n=1 Tax=Flavobacterium sp. MFBS3-15 TaxID=2989816 RepID=UPI0022360AB0|nr:bifunctional alpha,alpha-trehalose-phosphate synthase (UDP-forming)/trehalose-phosphatase [Flavobacterium sp. MFBS3-15]MCW4467715.1 bifunctional alpha,alpha-trehalose-phosphate synthase (UDP-forming)/trehalose-phosphatase [Flavobacterium sp. MFBS3-15]
MNKTIIVSNRLPIDLQLNNNELQVKASVGGLATGMKSVHAEGNGIWIGWAGLTEEQIGPGLAESVDSALSNEKCVRVPLTAQDIENYYYGFSNKALWPLFHYFQAYTEFELADWESYREVNQKFADVVLRHANEGDTVWVHDYQLLLLPKLLREKRPDLIVGFFLHIPFPSYELFRTCPWRDELLHGMLGADLIGFHTYDYVRHFLSSASRLAGLEIRINEITYGERVIKADFFPMGIDYNRFQEAANRHYSRKGESKSDLMRSIEQHHSFNNDARLVLSIDRMDYTKGIPNRILAFEYFLNKYPKYKEKVRLVMLAVPSRENVPQYQKLKRETDELVGRINGKFATVNWTPIWYFYRSMPFENLIDLYVSSHVAMITPIRDGMNLVAKEYVATRTEGTGVLILSEMAGAAKEMHDALLVNPNNFEQIANTLNYALEMPAEEQKLRLKSLQERLSRYNVERWADAFLTSLGTIKEHVQPSLSVKLEQSHAEAMKKQFNSAKKRLLLLDYDGTLVGFKNHPSEAIPDEELYSLLDTFAADPDTDLVIISGRDRNTINTWFGGKDYTLVTDHGVWLRRKGKEWASLERLNSEWKESVRPIMESFADNTPGTFVEEKDFSLAWHYRRADADLAAFRTMEIKHVLTGLLGNNSLSVLEGNKVIEVKSSNINKGRATARLLADIGYDFIFAIGDDWTDEYMFEELPTNAWTIKVGSKKTAAKYFIKETDEVRVILANLTK